MPSDPSEVDKKLATACHGATPPPNDPRHGFAPAIASSPTNQQTLQNYINRLNAIMASNPASSSAVSSQVWQSYAAAASAWRSTTKEEIEEDEFTKFVMETRMAKNRAIVGWAMFAVWSFVLLAALLCAVSFDWAIWHTDFPASVRSGLISGLALLELAAVGAVLNSYKKEALEWLNSK